MRKLTFNSALIIAFLMLFSCKQQQARMPISHSSGEFLKASAERNKKLIKGEESQIDSIIKNNPKNKYIASQKGYWYYYDVKNDNDSICPKKGDVAYYEYDIKDIKGKIIYSKLELKPQTYIIDKQNIIIGLRDGIKLMHKEETVTFLFPSHVAFGYHGDNKRIGTNEPIICTVTLNDIKKENKTTQE
jgi:gliding motility-associated peptidyl-prolyl isomerase